MTLTVAGASSGFGRALTEVVLDHGEVVIAAARRTHLMDDLLANYTANRVLVLKMDVTQQQDVIDAFKCANAAFGRIDVVFNNAGYSDLGELEGMNDDMGCGMFQTNFWGAARVTREAVRFFREENPSGVGGHLLQMSSIYGLVGGSCQDFYSASKHALEGLTKCLAQEIDPAWNIRITIVEPGYFGSEINAKLRWSPPHRAYSNPALPGTLLRESWNTFVPPGDAVKAAEVFFRVTTLANPPLHLLVGKDANEMARKTLADLEEDVNHYGSWSDNLEVAA
ncbi:NAD-P-binding protein [Trametes elegans]|nr:NAD-P-binding protein [Trametes elegans]